MSRSEKTAFEGTLTKDFYLHGLDDLFFLVALVCPVQHHDATDGQVLHRSVASWGIDY